MSSAPVTYVCDDPIATVTLNRPELHNALSDAFTDEIAAAFERARDDDRARVIVLRSVASPPISRQVLTTWLSVVGTKSRQKLIERLRAIAELDALVSGPAGPHL